MKDKRVAAIPVFDKDSGETLTYTEINTIAIEVYNKFNILNSLDIGTIDTGKFRDQNTNKPIYYPNYCAWMLYSESPSAGELSVQKTSTIDILLNTINTEIDELLNIL